MRHPYAVVALMLLIAAMGAIGYFQTPVDLFPETAPPQVVVITSQPGARADEVADNITEVIEKEINTISGLDRVRSTSRDQVSSIVAEFDYAKALGEAVVDVQSALARIQGELPNAVREPRIYRLTESTSRPLVTLAMSPKPNSDKSLRDLRLLAENQITDRILGLEHIADGDVFGGHQPEIKVHVDRDKLAAHNLSIDQVVAALDRKNVSIPGGTIYTEGSEYLVNTEGQFERPDDIAALPIRKTGQGLLRVRDVATVKLSEADARSLYHGNGKPAIALGVIRTEDGPTVQGIDNLKTYLPELKATYPDIRFEITQDQQPLVDANLSGMRNSILQAIALTVAVIFLFLADLRAALIVSISIPLAFLFTLGVLWLTPFTLNMVTLSGLIVATGMVVDSSVVVLENIYRHFREKGDGDAAAAATAGSREVFLAITAGMLTTLLVLLPVVFVGGYPQRTIGRASLVICITLLASLTAAVTVVPLLATRVLKRRDRRPNALERAVGIVDRGVEQLWGLYRLLLRAALRFRLVTLLLAAAFVVLSFRLVIPLIGQEQMPPMDTGISIVSFTAPATARPEQVVKTLNEVEAVIQAQPGVEMISSVVGSEPGSLGFGTGAATAQSATITVHLVDRFQREPSIWQIQQRWREQINDIPGIQDLRISEFGATPVATTKAPLDIVIAGPDARVLDQLARQALERLKGTPGLIDVQRSWYFDEVSYRIAVDPALARTHGTSTAAVAEDVRHAVDGQLTEDMRLEDYLDIPIRVQYVDRHINSPEQLGEVYVRSSDGPIPLRTLAETRKQRERPMITRQQQRQTIDITGVNSKYTIGQVSQQVRDRLDDLSLPQGYTLDYQGTVADMRETQQRLGGAILTGLVLLFVLLFVTFRSFIHPLTILVPIPLGIAGGLWSLLIFDKPMSMPGTLGMIFLAGVLINNSVLLMDFILRRREQGYERDEAIFEAVRLRLRPILMTTGSTVLGLSPLAFALAVGLERMSPLAIVAGSGLIVGTVFTLIVTPVAYSTLDAAISRFYSSGRNGERGGEH